MTTTEILDHPVRSPFAGVLTNVTEGADVTSALAECGLLWGVEAFDVAATRRLDDGSEAHLMPDHKAIMRIDPLVSDEPIGLAVVKKGYTPIPNLDAFLPLQPLVDSGRITLTQGGMTKDGRHAFLLADLADGVTMLDQDPHQRMLIARTSHDGTGALRIGGWAKRLWCTNQIPSLVCSRNAAVSIHHGRGATVKVEALGGMLDMIVGSMDVFDEEWRRLASTALPPAERMPTRYVKSLFRMPEGPHVTDRMRQTVRDRRAAVTSLLDAPTNANVAGTKAALIAAATEWDQHFRGKDAGRRAVRLLEGRSTEFTHRAWTLASAL